MASARRAPINWPAPVFAPSGAKPAAPNPVNLELAPEQTPLTPDALQAIVAAPATIAEPEPGLFVVDVRGCGFPDWAGALEALRRFLVAEAVLQHGNAFRAGIALGISDTSVSEVMKRHGIVRPPRGRGIPRSLPEIPKAETAVAESTSLTIVLGPRTCGSCRTPLAKTADRYCDDRCEDAATVYRLRGRSRGGDHV